MQEVIIWAIANVTATRRDNAAGYCATKAEGVAHGHHRVAYFGFGLGPIHMRESFVRLDLEQCQIGFLIRANHLGIIAIAILEGELHGFSVLHHVVVGDGITISR